MKMNMMISNIGCSILASIIYDVSKICTGKYSIRKDEFTIDKINHLLLEKLDTKYEPLCMSGEFHSFLDAPFFKDTIENYIIYKITGNCNGNILELRKNDNPIVEEDVIKFLSDHLFHEYYKETLYNPQRELINQFFKTFFNISADYIFSFLKTNSRMDTYLINKRMDMVQKNILLRLDETVEIIKNTMKCEYIPVECKYRDYAVEYYNILKANNSRAHIYLLDILPLAEFYVPPFLRELSPKQELRQHLKNMRRDYLESAKNGEITMEDCFDDWKFIFDCSNIVYVTGGAGYGKSLFLRKIINDFCNINVLNSSEYLVIYGDLKSFYIDGEHPISVVKFLQNCMLNETLMDEKQISIDMIEYYIKTGRCLILLDALDEVEKQKREHLHKRIISYFKNQNPNNRICITSRNRGFIPEKDVEVFDILPLEKMQIETYVDKIIKLGRFAAKDKQTFLSQTKKLVEKGFLNSFLVLSLLINIYRAERELPENKIELYQKCFDYIAHKREMENTKAQFNWDLISYIMKDNTFLELAKMCYPNNSDIGKKEIVEMLCKTYRGKFTSEAETELAANIFLAFCSDRTELFVPAAGEERYKFFHRSFYEYFYSQYIFLRIKEIKEIYASLEKFDVDSEVFELTFSMMKQKDEPRYQQLIEYVFEKVEKEVTNETMFNAFNILTLAMQVVDDKIYIDRYLNFLLNNKKTIAKNINQISNQSIIYNIISNNSTFIGKVNESYELFSKLEIVKWFLSEFQEVRLLANNCEIKPFKESNKCYFIRKLGQISEHIFYLRLYIKHINYNDFLFNLNEQHLNELFSECEFSKKVKYKKQFFEYSKLKKNERIMFQHIILNNSEGVKNSGSLPS